MRRAMKNAFTLIRVSAEDQLKGYGPDVQWYDDVLPNAPLLGLEVSEDNRHIIQESATGWERVKFEAKVREAMALHKAGEIDALLFPRVDRETRFLFGSMPLLAEVVQSGLAVYFARERLQLDPNDSESVERYLSKATQAQAYVETMKLNTARGRRRRLLQDHKLPTGRGVLYGYDYDKEQSKNIANDCLDVVRMIGMWVLEERITLNQVCRRLMYDKKIPSPKGSLAWSRSTVRRILRNPTYAGRSYAGKTAIVGGKRIVQPRDKWIEVPDAVDRAAFSWDEWEGIQRQLDLNRERSPRNQKYSYELKGRVYCKLCGRKYRGAPMHGKPYFRCSGRNKLISLETCHSRSIKATWLADTVWAEIAKVLKNQDVMLAELRRQQDSGENVSHLEEQLARVTKQLAGYDDALDRYLRMYGTGLYDYARLEREATRVKADQEKAEAEKAELGRRLKEARQQRIDDRQIEQLLTRLASSIDNAGEDDKQLAYDALNINVWIDSEDITIEGILPVTDVVDSVYQPS